MPIRKRFGDQLVDRFDPEFLALPRATPAVVALSGGLDSCCLLHLLRHAGFTQLTACHLDHSLRPCSASDAGFVQNLCNHLGVPLLSERIDVADLARSRKVSVETAGRTARHALFHRAAGESGTPLILLAHHADDQVETLLAHLLRGAGPRGLAAMRPSQPLHNGHARILIRRPMLQIWRAELETLAREESIPFRNDPTNSDPGPTRNRIRLRLLPLLEDLLGCSLRKRLLHTAQLFRAEDELLDSLLPPAGAELSVQLLRTLPLALQRRTIHRWLSENVPGETGFETVENVRSLLQSRRARVNLPAGHHARRTAGKLWIQHPTPDAPAAQQGPPQNL